MPLGARKPRKASASLAPAVGRQDPAIPVGDKDPDQGDRVVHGNVCCAYMVGLLAVAHLIHQLSEPTGQA
eukprot:12650960-Alexandrium_andersonii.AAC.1